MTSLKNRLKLEMCIRDRFVDEHTLTTSISRIRSKIESDGGAPYILSLIHISLRLRNHTLASGSSVLQSQQHFVIVRCQSPHEAALGERALPDRPAIYYSSFREVSDSLQWTVHSQSVSYTHLNGKPARQKHLLFCFSRNDNADR